MGLMSRIKRLLPVSSRSFHERTDYLQGRLCDLQGSLEYEITQTRLLAERLEAGQKRLEGALERNRRLSEGLYYREGEDPALVMADMFRRIPPATGGMRLLQLANARLMADLDALCGTSGLTYWFAFGTLVAALSREGFIPWDDDIDICMLREDVERLRELLRDDPRFQLTLVYDGCALCKQYRFSLRDSRIPCFVDVCVWDWAPESTPEADDALRALRLELQEELAAVRDADEYWREHAWLFADEGSVVQAGNASREGQDDARAAAAIAKAEAVFAKYQARAEAEGLVGKAGEGAGALAYGLENIYDVPQRRILWLINLILPVSTAPFEGYIFHVPANACAVADECFPVWPYLPSDMADERHFSRDVLGDPAVRRALEAYAAGDGE